MATSEIDGMGQPNRRRVRAHLLPLKPPDRGKVFVLHPGEVIIGCSADKADIVLEGPGLAEAHARILVSEHLELEFEDLKSPAGCLLNGKPLNASGLLEGDTLGLGPEVVVKVEFTDRDVRELIKDLHRSSNHDSLTGLLNRRSFAQRLAQEQAVVSRKPDTPVCVALLDADHFKKVNDTYGHAAGDTVLRGLAEQMRHQLRTEDELGRYGGEEFIALLRGANLEEAGVILNRLRESVAETVHHVSVDGPEQEIQVSVSIGVALLDGARSSDESIARADEALYRAKQSGRNRVCLEQDTPSEP